MHSGLLGRRSAWIVVLGAGALSLAEQACSNDNAVVGGECAPGLTECALRCVDLANDPNNCGACGNVCPPNVSCVGGVCGGSGDGAPGDATLGDGDDGSNADGDDTGYPDGPGRDGFGGDDSSENLGDACTPPYDNAQHCGDCFTVCSGINDTCKPVDGGYACMPLCNQSLSECNGQCYDLTSDPNHCGNCNTVCFSQICQNSQCVGGTNGGIVLIGHDYLTTPPGVAQARVLSNAAFIPVANPLALMSFEHYADPTAVGKVKTILTTAAQQIGRTLNITSTSTDSDVPNKLNYQSYQVLVVHDLRNASPGVLGPLGTSWASTLTTFAKVGGVVIVLDGAAGATQEMPQLVTSTTLLNVGLETQLAPGTHVDNVAPNDFVGNGVGAFYGVGQNSVRVATEANGGSVTWVVQWTGADAGGPQPVVVHKIIQ
jgi:hypothetical protein